MKSVVLMAAVSIVLSVGGCVCTRTPVDEQRWYEYQVGWGQDGYTGNKPWFYYTVFVPLEVIVSLFY